MNAMLRILGLSTILVCTVLSSAGADTSGNCQTLCFGSGITQVVWPSTEEECCSRSVNPCPPGSSPSSGYAWAPDNGFWGFCPPI
ncbi:MAG TPA: hypothetical protein VEL74_14915 [Thermoanaerobaculia bacterium]|nr:hypothetical protein [Thermoanaerobaculia bacterium]